jgi:cell division septum initiation protein DivIVA
MLSFEDPRDDNVNPTPAEDRRDRVNDLEVDLTEPITHHDRSPDSAARILELAAMTADQLVTEAQTEAESLVSTAQADADAILETSRNEAHRIAAELSRIRHEQTADLDRERATALAGLAQERAAIERQIADLRHMQSDHRNELRRHLTAQLALLDATVPEPPTASSR